MPADIVDHAQDLNETRLANALASRKTLTIPFSGSCLACHEPVSERRYCDSDCREAHENHLRRNARA